MSVIPTASEFLKESQVTNQQTYFKLAIVSALFSNGVAKLIFDGESTASEKKYPYLASYTPQIGDRVILAVVSGTYVVLGKITFTV
jgi:hypothetical protein